MTSGSFINTTPLSLLRLTIYSSRRMKGVHSFFNFLGGVRLMFASFTLNKVIRERHISRPRESAS